MIVLTNCNIIQLYKANQQNADFLKLIFSVWCLLHVSKFAGLSSDSCVCSIVRFTCIGVSNLVGRKLCVRDWNMWHCYVTVTLCVSFVCDAEKHNGMYSIYYSNQTHSIKYICTLKRYFRHVLVPVYHLQGAQYARFKTNCQWQNIIEKVLLYAVGSFLDVHYIYEYVCVCVCVCVCVYTLQTVKICK